MSKNVRMTKLPAERPDMTSSTRRTQGLRQERMHASPQFADGRFVNTYASTAPDARREGMTLSMFGEFAFGGSGRRPVQALPALDPLSGWRRPAQSGLR